MKYAVKFNPDTMKSVVHRAGCVCTRRGPGGYVTPVEADSPQEAIRIAREREDSDARGIPKTTIAPCAR